MISPEQISAARSLSNTQQKEMAAELGVSPSIICQWERGLRPPPKRIAAIIEFFKQLGVQFINEQGLEGVVKRNGHNGT